MDGFSLLEMRGIAKSFGAVRANDGIDIDVGAGQILGLLGENGSGKTTLMKVLFGMVRPDAGRIVFRGTAVSGHDPKQAIALGIGMVHQQFMLVESMTVAENVMLGWERAGRWLAAAEIADEIRETSRRYGLDLDPEALVGDLSLGRRQRVEILKAILRGAELLILDEPTSNLSPPEVGGLLTVMRRLKAEGKGTIFISHKLGEVLEICDDVIVLRDGRVAGRRSVADATRAELARMMVGRNVTDPLSRAEQTPGVSLLSVERLNVVDASGTPSVSEVTFDVRVGEVLAIAGVDGNGQIELAEALAGLRSSSGRVVIAEKDVTRESVAARVAAGLSYIPPDRGRTSMVASMSIAENLAMRDVRRRPFSRAAWLSRRAIMANGSRLIKSYAIRAPSPATPAGQLSGGNQQKVVVARELDRKPQVLIALQATWGLDPGATRFVLEEVLALRGAGAAVLYISSELEEVLAIGDRIGVLHAGRLVGLFERKDIDLEAIGLMMAGAHEAKTGLAA
jgi:simple sugar transport system ATP-binding protein